MNKNLMQTLNRPPVYTKTEAEFWNDKYISKQMLAAHLNPEFEAASRKLDFIEKSVSWMKEILPPSEYPLLLDLGCGPGIYAERFTQSGFKVTGVDYSQRSIHYAIESACKKNLNITYLYQDYLNLALYMNFDVATMIYCDYGALSTQDRKTVLNAVYRLLRPAGKFLFDVFSKKKYDEYVEQQTWEHVMQDGFWRKEEHLVLNRNYKYENNVSLKQAIVITQDKITPYNIWDTYFTKEAIIKEVEEVGFHVCEIYGDVAGSSYQPESDTMAILVEKK